jgi:glycosyltransferase involved in cell wall biosynthesis
MRHSSRNIRDDALVSVILTSHNYEDYVAESIRSVLDQTYRNIELIIVDDGSTDGSKAVIEKTVVRAEIPVQTIYKSNGGQASALNAGYECISGEVVCFLDSDDYGYEDKIEKLLGFMRMFPDGGIYQHQMGTGSGPKQELMVSGDLFAIWKSLGIVNKAVVPAVVDRPFIPTSGLASTRWILDKVFPLPEELVTCPDGFMTRTSCVYGPLYSLPTTLGVWRDHATNAGKQPEYRRKFWVGVLMPALNRYYRERSIPIQFTYEPPRKARVEDETTKTPVAREIIADPS